MKKLFLLLSLGIAFGGAAAGCNEGVDTTPPPGDDDDDDGVGDDDDDDDGSVPTPTPAPTPAGLAGEPWTTTATPASDFCALGVLEFPYGNAGTAPIGVAQTGSDLYFDIGLHLNPSVTVGDEPSGTVDGDGDFTQSLSYCGFNGASTLKYYQDWTGTFATDGLTFDATMVLTVYLLNGDHRAACGTTTFDPYGDCSNPGTLSYAIHGVKN